MDRFLVVLTLSLSLVTSLVACAGNINPDRQMNDAVLSANVVAALDSDPDLARYDIVVDATGPVITLLGELPSSGLRARAEQIAARVEGVEKVINQIRVAN